MTFPKLISSDLLFWDFLPTPVSHVLSDSVVKASDTDGVFRMPHMTVHIHHLPSASIH